MNILVVKQVAIYTLLGWKLLLSARITAMLHDTGMKASAVEQCRTVFFSVEEPYDHDLWYFDPKIDKIPNFNLGRLSEMLRHNIKSFSYLA